MNKEIEKYIRNACGRFIGVHCNARIKILRTEANLPNFGAVWYDNRCIANILSLLKEK